MVSLSHSPHVCHFILDFVVFFFLLRYDFKLKVSNWPLNINIWLFYTIIHCQRAGVDTKVPYSSLGSYS